MGRWALLVVGLIPVLPASAVLGPSSWSFAFVVVWWPMAWLGTMSRLVQIRLPARYHRLLPAERDGRIYERLGVRLAKAVARRGPVSWWNPTLRMPRERTPAELERLAGRMRDAEATHAVLFVATLPVVVNALVQRWWTAAALTLAFDVVMNGYPVMLQRYNRGRLAARWHVAGV